MKKDLFTIGEVAALLNVPTATLRFWEESGLFSVEKRPNRYRCYTSRDVARIADVVFFRNLGISVSQVRGMEDCTREQYAGQMREVQAHLNEKLREYERMGKRIQVQLHHLDEVQRLTRNSFALEEVPFEAVASFDYQERDKLARYAQEPSCYVRYYDTRDMSTEARGITALPEYAEDTLLWKKQPGTRFLTFLIREKVDRDYESDVERSLARVQSVYRTGHLLAQYLVTAKEDGERIDYLKAYLEVEPLEPSSGASVQNHLSEQGGAV